MRVHMSLHKGLLKFGAVSSAILAIVIATWYALLPESASEEYKYTMEMVARLGCLPLLCLSSLCFLLVIQDGKSIQWRRLFPLWVISALVAGVILLIPILFPPVATIDWRYAFVFSLCWIVGALLLAVAMFLWAARLRNMASGALCFFASLFLAFALGETGYLLTDQHEDGHWTDVKGSAHARSGKAVAHDMWSDNGFGPFPRRPTTESGAVAHREMRYDEELFDVFYTFNKNDHRRTPACSAHPLGELMVFGCSFTFGHGLMDEQTWPWLLAQDLGPSWCVENYGHRAFGAQQMLLQLEENRIVNCHAPIRQALFLSINDHIRRNSGLFFLETVPYELQQDGTLTRGVHTSHSPLRIFHRLPAIFNGSQLVQQICKNILTRLTILARPQQLQAYVAILAKSAQILREKYNAPLTVLLWPDIEEIAPLLKKEGVTVLYARNMLKDWDTLGEYTYHIVPDVEPHPNEKATRELAAGLSQYYRNISSQ